MAKAIKFVALAVGAVALIATGVGAVALGGLAGTLTVAGVSTSTLFLVAGGLSVAASLLQKGPVVPASQTDRLTANIDPRAYRKTWLGQTAAPVDVRYEEWSGPDQENCDWIVALASHAADGLEEIWLNSEMAWSATTGVTSKYAGYFSVPNIVLEGTPENAFTFASGKWNAGNAHLTGCAYARLRFKVTGNSKKAESPFSSGIPSRITIIGRGAKLYDPRRDSTVPGGAGPMRWNDQSTWRYMTDDGEIIGENLPLQILYRILGWRIRNPFTGEMKLAIGSGVPGRRIGLESFQVAANIADELVNRAAGGTEPRYHGAGVISEGDDPKSTLDAQCAACCARFRDTSGKLTLVIMHNDLASIAIDDGLHDDDVVGAFSWDPDPSLEATPNIVRGQYVDATTASLYQLIDYPDVALPSPDGQDRIFPLNLGFVESPSQAQRIAKQVLQRKQYLREFSAPFDIRAWKYAVGDVVPFTFAPLGFNRVAFRVKEQEQGQGSTCNMVLAYESDAFYRWDADDTLPVIGADPIVYDHANNPLILAIDAAADTSLWSGVSGVGKPADDATVGGTIGIDVKLPTGATPFPADIINPRFDLGPDGRLTSIDFEGVTKELGQIDLDAIGGASTGALAAAVSEISAALEAVDGAVADARSDSAVAIDAAEGRLEQKVSEANQAINAAEGRLDQAISDAAVVNESALQRLRDALGTLEDTSADAFAAGDGARRVVEDAIDKLAQAQLVASLTEGTTRQIMASAGVYIDAATGTARIYGVDKAANQITEAEIRLSAAEGNIKLRVTRTDMDAAILTAQLGGANADLGPLLSRIANAEVNLDALGAAIRLKADQTLLGELAGRVTTVRADLDAATGALSLKADSATVTGLDARVSSAEATLTALGDVSSYATSASAIRLLDGQAADNAENTLRALLAGDAGTRSNVEQLGLAYQSLTARIIDGDAAEAQQRNLLLARVRDTEASVLTERLARVDTEGAISGEIETFRAEMDDSLSAVGTRITAVSQSGESTATTVRVVGAAADADGDAALRAILAGDAAVSSAKDQIALVREETTARSVEGELSLIRTRQDFLVQLNGNRAEFTSQIDTLSDTTQAIVRKVETFTATFDAAVGVVDSKTVVLAQTGESTASTVRVIGTAVDQDGDAALRGLLAGDATAVAAASQVAALREETTSRQVAGELSLITVRQELIAKLNGNSASFSRDVSALTDQQQSLARDAIALRAQFDGNTADVAGKLIALATADQTLGGRIDAFRSVFDGNAADVSSQLIALATADQTLSGRIDDFHAVFDENAADVSSQLIALVTRDQTISGRIDDFHAAFDSNTADVASRLIALATADQTLSGRIDDFHAAFDSNTADVASRLIALATADQTLSGEIDQFRSAYDGNAADVSSKLVALASVDQALGGRIDDFRSTFDGNAAEVSGQLTALATADETLAGRLDQYGAEFDANKADMDVRLVAQADATGAVSGRVETLSTTVADHTAKITETSSSVDGLKLKAGVELDSGGHLTGWQANNDGKRGDFTIVTDAFKVIRPGATAEDEGHTVFAIGDDGIVYILSKLRAASIEADMLQVNSAVVPAFVTFSTTIDGPGWDGSTGEGGSAGTGGGVIDEKMS